MSVPQRELRLVVEYPESDGEPMAETELHVQLLIDLRFALRHYFRDDPQTYVGANMLMYYVEGEPTKCQAPDVFVVRGAPKEPMRRTWKVWEEGRAPDMVIELLSEGTWAEDLQKKWRVYEQIGVKEYYIFDPEYLHLACPLLAYRLADGELLSVSVSQGVVFSRTLGLEVVDTGTTLRLRNPQTGEFLPTAQEVVERAQREIERAQREAERARRAVARVEQATAARLTAEDRTARLAAKLRALGVDPDQL